MEWILIEDEPDPDRIWVGVTARENMSVLCAGKERLAGCRIVLGYVCENLPSSMVLTVRYCLDWVGKGS